jgi:hypothetical protein
MPCQAEHPSHGRSEVHSDFWNPTGFYLSVDPAEDVCAR